MELANKTIVPHVPTHKFIKAPTGSTGPTGEQIFDVFSGGQRVSESDFIASGIDIANVPIGEAPTGFESEFLPVSGSDNIKKQIKEDRDERFNLLQDDSFAGILDQLINPVPVDTSELEGAQERITASPTSAEQERIRLAGQRTGATFDPLIGQAEREKKRGLPKAIVAAGERGGFLSTQFAGRAALQPTQGGDFVGAGGELSRISSEFDFNISQLQVRKQNAIQQAEQAEKEFIRTGKQVDFENLRALTAEARAAQDQQQQILNNKINALLSFQELQNELNKPISMFNESRQEFLFNAMENFPSAFTDVTNDRLIPGSLNPLTLAEINERIVNSPEFIAQQQEEAPSGFTLGKGQIRFDAEGNVIARGIADVSGVPITLGAGATPRQEALVDAFSNLSLRFSKDQAARATTTFRGHLASGDEQRAKQFLQSGILSAIPTEQFNRTLGRFEALAALEDIEQGLLSFKERGGDTGLITGSLEAIQNKLGKTKDPKLAEVSNTIRLAIVDYRKAVSGAAFTESESKEYERIFPSIGKGDELNEAKTSSLRNTFNRNNRVLIENIIGIGNYDPIFGKTELTDTSTTFSPEEDEELDTIFETGEFNPEDFF